MKIGKHIIYGAVAVAAAVALSLSVQAQNLLVDPNFSIAGAANAFEQPNPIPIPAGISGGWGNWASGLAPFGPNGNPYSVLMWENTWNPSGVYQILPATAGLTYTLDAWAAWTANADWATPALMQLNFYDPTGTDELASFGSFEAGPSAIGVWQPLAPTVATAPAGTGLVEVYLMYMDSDSGAGGAQGMYYGQASLTAVPEPSTIALVACGLLGMLVIRRRKA